MCVCVCAHNSSIIEGVVVPIATSRYIIKDLVVG